MRRILQTGAACAASLALLLLAGCGSNSQPFNDTPTIMNLFPSSAAAGGPAFTMNITGTGFIAQSTVFWNNMQLTATLNAETLQLSASVPAADIATAGVAQVVVVSPAPGGGMSNAVTFNITPPSNPVPAITSVTPSSTAVGVLPPNSALLVNGSSFTQSSTVAFNGVSRATNFVSATQLSVPVASADVAANATISVTVSNPAPGGGVSDAASFVVGTGHSVRLRAAAMAAVVSFPQLISVGANGSASNGLSASPVMSTDGRFVAFYSTATNLVAVGSSGNIFVRDTCLAAANCMPQTIAVDVAADGSAPNAIGGDGVAMSADGRFVAFASGATNLLDGATVPDGKSQVYLRDMCVGTGVPDGCTPHTQLVSLASDGSPGSGKSDLPSISSDGRYVAFLSSAPNLLAGSTAGNGLLVRDTCSGAAPDSSCVPRTYSAPVEGSLWAIDRISSPAISADGRYVAFVASDLSTPVQTSHLLLADLCLGPDTPAGCRPSLSEVSVSAGGLQFTGVNSSPSISADGRFVAYVSQSPGDTPGIFLRDTCSGISAPSKCSPTSSLLAENGVAPSISSSGRYVSYISAAPANSVPSASPGGALYVYDTCFAAVTECTPQAYAINGAGAPSDMAPFAANAWSSAPLNADGSFIVFSTSSVIPGLPLSGLGDVLLSVTPF